jgi:hypothetical protein
VTGSSNDGREHSPWSIVSGETGLAHAGAIVDYQSWIIVVTHIVGGLSYTGEQGDLLFCSSSEN